MAIVIKPKRSEDADSAPTTSDIVDGELAINVTDKKIYIRHSNDSIVTLSDAANLTSGSTSTIDATTDIILDADGGDIFFKDDGTTFGSATNTSGNLIVKSGTTTALTFSGANVTAAGTVDSGAITSTGTVTGTGFTIGSAAIDETELEILDGATVTTTELNLLDGGTSVGSSITVGDSDGFIVNDGGTMKTIPATDVKTYAGGSSSSAADDISVGDAAVTISTSSGNITIDAAANNTDIIFKGTDATADITMLTLDGSEAGAATFNSTITGGGLLTTGGNIVIPDAGNIGSASDTDAIAIASTGVVTFSQVPVLPDDTVATADIQDDAVTIAKLAGAAKNLTEDTFDGDGSDTTFTLSVAPPTTQSILVTLDGIVQPIANYSLSTTTLTMSTAPPNGVKLRVLHLGVGTANVPVDDSVTGAKIADDAIDSEHYTDGSIDTAHIADSNVTTAKIAADAITEAEIADDAVESEHLNDNVISGQTEITSGLADADELLYSDGGTIKRVGLDTLQDYILTGDLTGSTVTLDSSGDVVLDADGGDVFFKDDGTTFGSATNTSGNLIIKSGTTTAATFSGANVTLAGTVDSGAITSTGTVTGTGFTIGSAAIDETELEILDGATVTTAELNILDGVTSTAAELNILDGVTSTAAELNLLDGGTSVGSSITVGDSDGFIVNDGGTMKTIPATDLSTYAGGGGGAASYNGIINGDFTVWQRGTNFTSGNNDDDSYTADRWVLVSAGDDVVDVKRQSGDTDTSVYSLGLDVETTNLKFGIVQIIENKNCAGLGDYPTATVSLSFKAKVSSTTKLDNVKAAVLSWSSTADSVTSDVVSAWNGEGTDPTLATNWTYENTPANLNVTTSWVRYKIENISVDTAGTGNVAVFIWSDVADTTAGDILYITDVQLEPGDTANDYRREHIGTTMINCQRYYHEGMYAFVSVSSSQLVFNINFPTQMRTSPTTSHEYAQDGTANDIYNIGTAATPTFVPNGSFPDVNGYRFAYDFDAGLTADDGYQAYFYFEAEL